MNSSAGYWPLFLLLLLTGCTRGETERAPERSRPVVPSDAGSLSTSGTVPAASRVESFIASVEPFIREYPPNFRDAEHERQLRGAVKEMIEALDTCDLNVVEDCDLLTSIAYIFAMAHNLNLGTAPKAHALFERSLSKGPDNLRTNYLFGMFLASTRLHHFEAIPFLEKAYALGEKDAGYTIGLLLVERGDRDKGIQLLEAYAAEHPEQTRAQRMIHGIKDGTLKFREN